jgi:hypothetical protein
MRPDRDKKYLAWLHTLPCAVCGTWRVEAAHTGPHGLGQKSSDYTAIPLCPEHHRNGSEAHHRLGRKFAEHHGLNLPALTARLKRCYLLASGRTAS